MSEEVTLTQVLQAVRELSEDLKATESRLNDRFDKVESRLTVVEEKVNENGTKIDKFDAKFSIVTDEILSTKADVKMLRDAH